MTRSGRRQDLIEFCAVMTAENSMGEPVAEAFAPIGDEYVQTIYGSGTERRAAAINGGDQIATFVADANSVTRAIGTAHVIRFDEAVWDITGIATPNRKDIEFTAKRRAK